MKCYPNRYSTKLVSVPSGTPVSVTTNGTGYRLLPDEADGQSNASASRAHGLRKQGERPTSGDSPNM